MFEKNCIYNIDCLEFLKTIPDDSFDLVVTSPPYARKRESTYGGISEDLYADWLFEISEQIIRTLKPSGSFVLNVKEGCEQGCRQTYVLEYQLKMAKAFRWVETYIWNKTNPFPTGNKRRLKDAFEYCFHFSKTKEFKFFPNNCLVPTSNPELQENQKKRKNKDSFSTHNGSNFNMSKRIVSDWVRPGNVITFPSSCINIDHPAVFPTQLPNFFINLMTEEKDIVFDPFMGSGTTAVVAKQLNRYYVGCELNKKYIELINERIKNE